MKKLMLAVTVVVGCVGLATGATAAKQPRAKSYQLLALDDFPFMYAPEVGRGCDAGDPIMRCSYGVTLHNDSGNDEGDLSGLEIASFAGAANQAQCVAALKTRKWKQERTLTEGERSVTFFRLGNSLGEAAWTPGSGKTKGVCVIRVCNPRAKQQAPFCGQLSRT